MGRGLDFELDQSRSNNKLITYDCITAAADTSFMTVQ